MPTSFTFTKAERLKSRTTIGLLFKEGKSFSKFPIRIVWLEVASVSSGLEKDKTVPAQVAWSVPKRSFKHAVKRNRIRRQMQAAYRLNKALLYDKLNAKDKSIAVMLIYTGREAMEYRKIEGAIVKIMKEIKL